MLLELVKTLIGWAIMLPGFYLAGSFFGRFLSEQDFRLRGIFYTALGFITLIFYLIAAGGLGQLNPLAVLLFFAGVFLARRGYLQEFGLWVKTLMAYPWQGKNRLDRFLAIIFFVTVILTFGFCLLPETANDALCYQLNVPKQFILQGNVWPTAYDANSYMPVAMNLLYAVGLLFQSIGMTKLFHTVMALLLTYAIAFKVEHLAEGSRVAKFVALMFWLSPVVVNEIATAYVDVGVSFFLFISFLWLRSAVKDEKKSMMVIAGIGMGITVAVKFSLLLALPVLGLVGFSRWLKPVQFKKLLSFTPFFLAGIFLGCGYWFIRNLILMGNPTFPYFGEIFHTIGLKSYATYLDIGVPKTLWNFILLPAYLSLFPVPFDHHYWVGPFILLSFPALILSYKQPAARPYFFFTVLLTGAWFLTTQATRYLLPVLPFWYVAVGAGMSFMLRPFRRPPVDKIISFAAVSVTACLLLAGAHHYRIQFLPLTGVWSVETYLRKIERSYPAAQWMNQHLPKDARVFNVEEVRQFYFKRAMIREEFLNFFTDYTRGRTADEIVRFLKDQGVTHLMTVDSPPGGDPPPERLAWLPQVVGNTRAVERLDAVSSESFRDGKYTYTFYRLR